MLLPSGDTILSPPPMGLGGLRYSRDYFRKGVADNVQEQTFDLLVHFKCLINYEIKVTPQPGVPINGLKGKERAFPLC